MNLDFGRNNLGRSSSPYLRQHAGNPVNWQEWSREVLDFAKANDKPLFVSVGYATCHWCHVMADDTFSDLQCAGILNEHFVSVKVDREQRPDIDQFMMSFLVATQGSGGWPLNVFLSPELSPFFATTYLGAKPRFGRPGFAEVLGRILEFYREKREELRSNRVSMPQDSETRGESASDEALESRARTIRRQLDESYGGFGTSQKFPPHSTLLFTLYDAAATGREACAEVAIATLDVMARRGLHDHLGGGFFRYCVDREWTIPHFEKMLYDQAMLLWSYAVAADLFARSDYAAVARGVVACLEESFRRGDGYVSAHDADTDHEEGGTYLFTYDELAGVLNDKELALLSEAFEIRRDGNFEGKIHLVRRPDRSPGRPSSGRGQEEDDLARVLDTLLEYRRRRAQPAVDTKIVTSWNCLAGIALVEASRRLEDPGLLARALQIESFIFADHIGGPADSHAGANAGPSVPLVFHSSNDGAVQRDEFLEDVSALLLFETYLLESLQFDGSEAAGEHRERCKSLVDRLSRYRSGDSWLAAHNEDFIPVPAQSFDSPTPSGVSLANLALVRWAILSGEFPPEVSIGPAMSQDFANIAAMMSAGHFHEVHGPLPVPYGRIPLNSIQVAGDHVQDCYRGVCTPRHPSRNA